MEKTLLSTIENKTYRNLIERALRLPNKELKIVFCRLATASFGAKDKRTFQQKFELLLKKHVRTTKKRQRSSLKTFNEITDLDDIQEEETINAFEDSSDDFQLFETNQASSSKFVDNVSEDDDIMVKGTIPSNLDESSSDESQLFGENQKAHSKFVDISDSSSDDIPLPKKQRNQKEDQIPENLQYDSHDDPFPKKEVYIPENPQSEKKEDHILESSSDTENDCIIADDSIWCALCMDFVHKESFSQKMKNKYQKSGELMAENVYCLQHTSTSSFGDKYDSTTPKLVVMNISKDDPAKEFYPTISSNSSLQAVSYSDDENGEFDSEEDKKDELRVEALLDESYDTSEEEETIVFDFDHQGNLLLFGKYTPKVFYEKYGEKYADLYVHHFKRTRRFPRHKILNELKALGVTTEEEDNDMLRHTLLDKLVANEYKKQNTKKFLIIDDSSSDEEVPDLSSETVISQQLHDGLLESAKQLGDFDEKQWQLFKVDENIRVKKMTKQKLLIEAASIQIPLPNISDKNLINILRQRISDVGAYNLYKNFKAKYAHSLPKQTTNIPKKNYVSTDRANQNVIYSVGLRKRHSDFINVNKA